jgi:MMPL family
MAQMTDTANAMSQAFDASRCGDGLGLLFDTLVVRSLMTPSIAALLGRLFLWPQRVRPRPASYMLRPFGRVFWFVPCVWVRRRMRQPGRRERLQRAEVSTEETMGNSLLTA